MKIDQKDLYHGAALTQITEYAGFKALNKADAKYGHYIVNTDRRILMKYSSAEGSWHFSFNADDLATVKKDFKAKGKVFVVMVCGADTICILDRAEIETLLDFTGDQQSIAVHYPKGGGLRVENRTLGKKLAHKIPHNAFPEKIFAQD